MSSSNNNIQPGYIPTDSFIENNENESNIDQLLSVEVISTSQPSLSATFNPINMISSQTSLLSNIQQQNTLISSYLPQFHQMREEHQWLYREQQEQQRQQRRHRYRDPEEHRYIGYMLRLLERDPERFQEELDEQEHQAYLQRRSPTFDEMTDEILGERELEEYYLERMIPEVRQEIWEQDHLNELQGNSAPRAHGLPLDDLERYAKFLEEQLWLDKHDQAMRIYDMQNNDYTEECRTNDELLMQKEEWEDLAFRLQQIQ